MPPPASVPAATAPTEPSDGASARDRASPLEPGPSAPRPAPHVDAVAPAAEDTESRRNRVFGALIRYPTFRRLWLGAMAASLGQWMQQVALGWLALTLTDSESFVGLVGFTAGLPFLVVALPGGVLIDRVDRRRLMLSCQGLAALLAVVVAIDVLSGSVQPWHLLVAAFGNGSLQALLNPTQQALVPNLVARTDLTNALGLMGAGQNMTRVVGPSIAGLVIAFADTSAAFLLQAAALAVAFALVSRVAIPSRADTPSTSGTRAVFDGIRLIADRPDLRELFLLACIPTLFVFPYLQFLPVFARDILHIGAGGLGLMMAASGSGAVVGSLLVAARRQIRGAGRFVLGMTVGYGGLIVAVAFSRSVYLSLPLLVCAGISGASFMGMNNVLLQHRITDDVRGRVMGAYMLTWGLMPLGAAPMGLVADRFGAPVAVAGGAVISSGLAAMLAVRSRAMRAL